MVNETTLPAEDVAARMAHTEVTHYISVFSWLEAISLLLALLVVGWFYARHRRAPLGLMALGLLMLVIRYAVMMADMLTMIVVSNRYQWLWYTGGSCLGALGILLLAVGSVLLARENRVPAPGSCRAECDTGERSIP